MKKLHIFGAFALAAVFALCSACARGGQTGGDPPKEDPPKEEEEKGISSGFTGTAGGVAFTLPDLGTEVSLHTQLQSKYLKSKYVALISNYADGVNADPAAGLDHRELSHPAPVNFTWTAAGAPAGTEYTLSVSENADMGTPWTFKTEETSYSVYNLKVGTSYYWTVAAGEAVSGAASFTTEGRGPRNLYVDGVANVRDMGGWATESGKTVKQGLLFRCGRLNENYTGKITVTEAGIDTMLNTLGVKTEIDLRGGENDPSEYGNVERSMLGDSVAYHHIGMNWDGNIFDLNLHQLKEIFTIFADEASYPIIFHCSIGTDRTGFVAYLLNALLGVDENDLARDYLFSNFAYIQGAREMSGITKAGKGFNWIINQYEGEKLSDKARAALLDIGVTAAQVDKIVSIFLG